VLVSAGQIEEADEVVSAGAKMATQSAAPWVPRLMSAWKARVAVALGNSSAATEWLEGISTRLSPTDVGTDFFELIEFILGARVLIALQRYPEADDLLSRLLAASERGGGISASIEIQCLEALCSFEMGREEEALVALECALSTGDVRREAVTSANTDLFEPLTGRELDVLHLVAEGLRNDEIGEKLFISTHTVKVHAKNINAKLDTHSRSEAVARARRLGLLPAVT
jgi:LuxR family maltose regulon positive regulatory protein